MGEGTYGRVYEVTQNDNKLAFKRNLSPDGNIHVLSELDILNRLRDHPRIIRLEKITVRPPKFSKGRMSPMREKAKKRNIDDDILHFLFEMAPTNLEKVIHNEKLSLLQIKQLMIDILLGLEMIHDSDIIHRDIKTDNIAVCNPEEPPNDVDPTLGLTEPVTHDVISTLRRAKILDFGMSKFIAHDNLSSPGLCPFGYRAPEIYAERGDYGPKIDIWSAGCTFYEMIFLRMFISARPGKKKSDHRNIFISYLLSNPHYEFTGTERREYLPSTRQKTAKIQNFRARLTKLKRDLFPPSLSSKERETVTGQICELLEGMLKIDPEERWTATDALDCAFFDTHRDYIEEYRDTYPCIHPDQYAYNIKDCPARQCAMSVARRVCKSHPSWFSFRRMFHAIDLFDRVIRYEITQGQEISNEQGELYFGICLFIAVKYFSTLHVPVTVQKIFKSFSSRDVKTSEAAQIELDFILKIFSYQIYRHTVYEAICYLQPYTAVDFQRKRYEYALEKLTGNQCTQLNDLYPSDFANEVVKTITQGVVEYVDV